MALLAIDPATQCGWATSLQIYGTWDLRIRRDESAGMKLIRLRSKLITIQESMDLTVVAFERAAGRFKNDIMSHARFCGIIEMFCIDHKIDYRGYSPSEIKKHATGKGNCNKQAMIDAATQKLGYTGNNSDEADALWIFKLAQADLRL